MIPMIELQAARFARCYRGPATPMRPTSLSTNLGKAAAERGSTVHQLLVEWVDQACRAK
jgi:hypothetical protein